jgi:hypothetical protein
VFWEPPTDHDPMNTRDLLQQRWRQRRDLFLLPDVVVHDVLRDEVAPVFPEVRPPKRTERLVESTLRNLADEILGTSEIADYVSTMRQLREQEALFSFLDVNYMRPRRVGDPPFQETIEDLRVALPRLREKVTPPTDFARLLAALVWADELADDGYRDARVTP